MQKKAGKSLFVAFKATQFESFKQFVANTGLKSQLC